MGSSVTVRDIAKLANVSHGTVSRVLNNHPSVSEDNRQRVLQVAAELGYFGSKPSRPRPTGEPTRVAELDFLLTSGVDAGEQNFWIRILRGVEGEASKTGIKVSYRTINAESVEQPDHLLSALSDMRLSHVLLVGDADPVIVGALEELHVPFILVDSRIRGRLFNAVLCDDYEGAYIAVRYLIEQGHERIAFIGNTRRAPRHVPIYSIESRAYGYEHAMQEAGLSTRDLMFTDSGMLYITDGYAACKHLLEHSGGFTALFCASDLLTVGAMRALHEGGLRVPQDVSVIGEDSHMALLLNPGLTTIRAYPEVIGATAVRQMVAMAQAPDALPLVSLVPMDLVIRQSVIKR